MSVAWLVPSAAPVDAGVKDVDRSLLDAAVMMATADKPMMVVPTWWARAGWQMSDLGCRCPF
jgi:hypothetical protein